MPPAAFISFSNLMSGVGGLAAGIAVGAFIGQSFTGLRPVNEEKRRRDTAVGGFFGFALMIALILLSASPW